MQQLIEKWRKEAGELERTIGLVMNQETNNIDRGQIEAITAVLDDLETAMQGTVQVKREDLEPVVEFALLRISEMKVAIGADPNEHFLRLEDNIENIQAALEASK